MNNKIDQLRLDASRKEKKAITYRKEALLESKFDAILDHAIAASDEHMELLDFYQA